MTSAELIADPSTLEFIVAPSENVDSKEKPDYVVPVSIPYEIWYFRAGRLPELSMKNYPYTSVPKCYGLLSAAALEDAGIFRLQSLPVLSLSGQGVLLAVIDTGIDYTLPAFRDEGGFTRIRAIWDQNVPPEAVGGAAEAAPPPYGSVYTREQIDRALRSENPYQLVPQGDEDGHGTLLASIAAGSPDPTSGFLGAAPGAELVVVKLRPAKQYLKDFYFIPEGEPVYAESDILSALSFVEQLSEEADMPCVVLMGLGNNNGSHSGTGPLCEALDILGLMQRRAVVSASGNEAGKRHHFFGRAESVLIPRKVEIRVEKDMSGFYVEFWGLSPERFSLSVQSPTGELLNRSGTFAQSGQEVTFLFEGTRLTVDYQSAGQSRRDQLIFLRFEKAVRGIWTIKVYPEDAVTGYFHMWLPMEEMLEAPVYFLEPMPDVTLTSPSDAWIPMTVGGLNVATGGVYTDSGRGFDADGNIKPDFIAPAVNVLGAEASFASAVPFVRETTPESEVSPTSEQLAEPKLPLERETVQETEVLLTSATTSETPVGKVVIAARYIPFSGTSAAAALTAGSCALLLEWAAVRDNAPTVNSVDIKNLLIRGAGRNSDMDYPSTTMGYGSLQVYDAFESLRRRS